MGMQKPGQIYPTPAQSPVSSPSPMPIWLPDPSIKGLSFDQLLQQRGVRFIHQHATPCPNIVSVDSNQHNPDCNICDNNGMLHYGNYELWGIFSGNSLEKTFEAHGVWEIGTAVVTFPAEYPDGTQADFNMYDRLILPDFTVRLWELKEYEPRPGNIQELRYPIKNVEFVSSVINGTQKLYRVGVDFTVNSEGQIVWIDGRQPSYDHDLGRGEVLTWAFFANPVYIVVQSLRELRITQELVNGQKIARRLPQQVLIRRDFLPDKSPETVVNP